MIPINDVDGIAKTIVSGLLQVWDGDALVLGWEHGHGYNGGL